MANHERWPEIYWKITVLETRMLRLFNFFPSFNSRSTWNLMTMIKEVMIILASCFACAASHSIWAQSSFPSCTLGRRWQLWVCPNPFLELVPCFLYWILSPESYTRRCPFLERISKFDPRRGFWELPWSSSVRRPPGVLSFFEGSSVAVKDLIRRTYCQ